MWPQCGARRARKADSLPQRSATEGPRKPLPQLSYTLASLLFTPTWLTITGAHPYIEALGRAAARRDGASAKPLTVHTVTEHPAMISWPCSRLCVGCVGFCCLGRSLPGATERTTGRRGWKVPGCLTSESEERETWTAESLRAASGRGNLARKARKRLRRSTF